MEDAGSVLRRAHADLIVSKQTLEKARGIEVVRMNRDQRNQTLCFSSRPFVLCGLPVRRLPTNQLLYERRNGHFVLQVAGHPEYGVPFGQDRIVPDLPRDVGRSAEEPGDPVPERLRNAGDLLNAQGR